MFKDPKFCMAPDSTYSRKCTGIGCVEHMESRQEESFLDHAEAFLHKEKCAVEFGGNTYTGIKDKFLGSEIW